jgi:beta-lactam-binding protein with PASTA domain
MKDFFSFFKSKHFFIHLGIILVCIFLLFFGLIKWLSSYTHHGSFVEVPDFKNQPIANLNSFISDKDITYQIIDSIYNPKEKPGIVIKQDPEALIKVKHNRKVYLYVTGMVAPTVLMPKLVDRSERQARLIITTYGLKIGKFTEKSADCNGCVLSQSVNGKEVAVGEAVKKGSVVNLVIGKKDYYYNASGGGGGDSTSNQDPNFDNDDK